jgi:hypothetical protein
MGDGEPARGNPYAAPRETGGGDEPEQHELASELAYFPERQRHTSSVTAMYALMMPMLAGAAAAAVFQSGSIGLVAAGLSLGWLYWKRRRSKLVPRAKLRVQGDVLYLSGPAFSPPISLQLGELLDVYLDTKTIQRVQENPGPVPDLRFINATVSGEMDTARIALEAQSETFFLTEQHVSHTDANEWFSKIRRFLRKHGWVPEDERPA